VTSVRAALRHLRASAWLGWQLESNWADPVLFLVYGLARPLALALILVAIHVVVTGGQTADPRFAWMYVGNAFFVFVPQVIVGVAWTVVEDREFHQMLKYVYVSPIPLFTYFAGRAATKVGLAVLSVIFLLVFGAWVLHVPMATTLLDVPYGLLAFLGGAAGLLGLGLLLAGFGLVFARHAMNLNEGVAATFYLLCGAIFPVDLLPAPLRVLSALIPVTWWLEAMRRATLAGESLGMAGRLGDAAVLLGAVLSGALWLVAGAWCYRRLERQAKARGLLDQTTAY
jgi:ABC-2 type transport system permease protein